MNMEVKNMLPETPSRQSGRWWMMMMFALATIEAIIAAWKGYPSWPVVAAINAMVLLGIVISKLSTSRDIHKLIDGMVELTKAAKQ